MINSPDYSLALFDVLPTPVWRADGEGKFDFFNHSWLAFTGRELQQELGLGWLEGVHPDDRERVFSTFTEAFQARRPFETELRLHRHSGEFRWVVNTGRPFIGFQGEFAGYLGVCHDVTASKELERHLRESESMFRTLFDSAPDAVIAVDQQGLIVLANQRMEDIFGYSPNELAGQPLDVLMPDRYHKQHKKHVKGFFGQPRVRPMGAGLELFGKRKDGDLFPVDISLGPVHTGDIRLTLATVRDITDRKKAEAELAMYKTHLEELVELRTADLQREIAERKRAEEQVKRDEETLKSYAQQLTQSNRDLQDYAAIVSHDLQEPLRKIQAFGERLRARSENTLDQEGRLYLERMQDASARMQTMLNDLLTYSRVSTRGQPYQPLDLNQVAMEVISDLEIRIEETGGRVEVDELPAIEGDPLQMRQVFQNLIGNALKFHRPDAPPLVKVRGQLVGAGGPHGPRYVRLTFEDNGIGFDERFIEKLFQPFQRLHGRSEYEGSGMGLAICRKIVERHQGSITARSTPGVGTTFTIDLPVNRDNEPGL